MKWTNFTHQVTENHIRVSNVGSSVTQNPIKVIRGFFGKSTVEGVRGREGGDPLMIRKTKISKHIRPAEYIYLSM